MCCWRSVFKACGLAGCEESEEGSAAFWNAMDNLDLFVKVLLCGTFCGEKIRAVMSTERAISSLSLVVIVKQYASVGLCSFCLDVGGTSVIVFCASVRLSARGGSN